MATNLDFYNSNPYTQAIQWASIFKKEEGTIIAIAPGVDLIGEPFHDVIDATKYYKLSVPELQFKVNEALLISGRVYVINAEPYSIKADKFVRTPVKEAKAILGDAFKGWSKIFRKWKNADVSTSFVFEDEEDDDSIVQEAKVQIALEDKLDKFEHFESQCLGFPTAEAMRDLARSMNPDLVAKAIRIGAQSGYLEIKYQVSKDLEDFLVSKGFAYSNGIISWHRTY